MRGIAPSAEEYRYTLRAGYFISMNQKNHILICTLCDFHIGFDIDQVDQIVQKKQAEIHVREGIIEFRGYAVPFFDLPALFHCDVFQSNFVLLLNCASGHFCVPIGSIDAIVDVESNAGISTAESMERLVVYRYAKRIILWNDLPVPVIETERLNERMNTEKIHGES